MARPGKQGMGVVPTREDWPILTVETEANRDSCSTKERGSSLIGPLGSSFRYKSALAALVDPIFFSSPYTISLNLSPSLNKLGS